MPVKVSWNKHVDGAAPPKMIMSTMTMKPMPAGIVCPTRTGPPCLTNVSHSFRIPNGLCTQLVQLVFKLVG